MSQVLEDFCTYEQSRIWQIQHAYYEGAGAQAWSSGEVPSSATSCYPMALQQAQVLIAQIEDAVRQEAIAADEEIRVLEVGSGSGLFARHLFEALALDCGDSGRALLARLTYVFSDFSARSLEQALAREPLATLRRGGYILPALLDLTRPSQLTTLGGEPITGKLAAVFANYVCCALPQTSVRKTPSGIELKFVRLELRVGISDRQASAEETWTQILRDPARPKLLDAVELSSDWRPVALAEALPDPVHQHAFTETTAALSSATLRYPRLFLEFVRRIAHRMLPGAALFVTDFGTASRSQLAGVFDTVPSVYGNTINHGVDFPIFDGFCKAAGFGLLRTRDALHTVHRAAVVYGATPGPALTAAFRRHHVRRDRAQEWLDLRDAGRSLLRATAYEAAARALRKLVKLEPRSAEVHYTSGVACFRAGRYGLAIRYLKRGRGLDSALNQDFDFFLGYSYYLLNRDEDARRALRRSLQREERAATFGLLGKVYERLGRLRRARGAYRRALALEPEGPAADEVKVRFEALDTAA